MSEIEEAPDLGTGLEDAPSAGGSARLQWILGGLILACGIGIGFGGSMLWRGHRPHRGPFSPQPQEIARHLGDKYELTDVQVAAIEKVFADRQKEMKALREKMHGQRKLQMETLKTEMKAILNPDQFERWAKDFEEQRKRRHQFGRKRSGMGKGRGRGPHPAHK